MAAATGKVMAAEGRFEGAPEPGLAERLRLPDVWELTRRFSGLAAIAVLGVTMVMLTLRAEPERSPPPAIAPAAESAVQPPAPDVAAAAQTQRLESAILKAYARQPEVTIVYYLYATEDQRDLMLKAESEAAEETVVEHRNQYQYFAFDTSTPEGETAARDAIFEAMLLDSSKTRVVVADLRDW